MVCPSPRVLRLCGMIAMMVLLPLSVGHAGSRGDLTYRVRVLPLEFPFIAGFNDRQQVIGYGPQGGATVGFVWDAKHGFELIHPAGRYSDTSAWAIPLGINQHGEVAGYRSVGPGVSSAFLRDRSETRDLGAFVAQGLNDRGRIVGSAVLSNSDIGAVVWTGETGMVQLGGINSHAFDINNKGVAVGDVGGEAAVWTDIGIWQNLGVLGDSPFGPPRMSIAYAINDRGWVIGTSSAPAGGAFLWTPETGMENIGYLDLGADIHLSSATDISKQGTVIGQSLGWISFAGEYEQVLPRAFVWTRQTGMLALNDLVPAGWTVENVIAINDHDEILAAASHLNTSYTVVLEPVKGPLR